ncbi:Alpha-maltose-1-phosphate synthase [Roseibaca ekhonensis]|jgi:glycosyltransferase involved in cell wall biosynthesis|uniref:Alpha-maltose-1-phosphate synthase n=1 Tax=Roseinatronobacter ekhonensis TaxID=254356 RepID=A0A3B0MHK0_9RHOB|nr:glycosyltransferase family 4 protein [Roseibaca ekhonensis]SUZ32998.1 Alpha-maltose-1-phosphate synthase [Roseibaca ekhonensis]
MKILIAGENASARKGGEAILPLKYAIMMQRRGHDVVLVTHSRNREEITEDYPALASVTHFIEDAASHRFLWRVGDKFSEALRDRLFGNLIVILSAWDMRRIVRRLLRTDKFDLVHQPTPVSPATPSPLYGLGVPVVIGPMNGGMSYPPGFATREGRAAQFFLKLGRMTARAANRLWPGKAQAAILLVANERTRRALPLVHGNTVIMSENGVDLDIWAPPSPRTESAHRKGFRLVFMGRMIAWKGLDLTLQALDAARLRRPDLNITLDILGDGPERAWIEASGTPGVYVHGFLTQAECAARLTGANALILNSLRECGGAVILEAMALGVPVIASDWGGPSEYVTAETGLLVHPAPPDSFAERLADAVLYLADTPEVAAAMGEAGSARARALYDWEDLADRMEDIYRKVRA